MKILLRPVFAYYDHDEYQDKGLNYMNNQTELENDIRNYLSNVFFEEPDRTFQRLGQTNYYTVDTLPDEVIANIEEWYTGYLENAQNETAFTDMMDVKVEPQNTTHAEGRPEAQMYMEPMTAPPHPDYHFSDSDSRQEFMDDFDKTNNLESVNLDNLNGNGINFAGVSFRQSVLNDSSFIDAKLQLTNFSQATLVRTNFTGADLRYTDFIDADLTEANFSNALIGGVNFTGANLTNVNFAGAHGLYFMNSIWLDAANLADQPIQIPLQQSDLEDDEAVEGDKNTCYAVIDLYDKNIDKYLAKDPGNFILIVGKNKECESLKNLKQQYYSQELRDVEGYYECSQTVIDRQIQQGHTELKFTPEDYITDVEYVKVGSYNQYIVKPDWFYAGPAPEPRVFKLVSTGIKKRLISKRIATHANRIATRYGTNVVSDVHCDPKDTFEIFRLEPVLPKKKSTKRKTPEKSKTTKRKTTKRKTPQKTKRKVLNHRTTRRALTAADNTYAGGRRKKTTKKKTRKIYKK